MSKKSFLILSCILIILNMGCHRQISNQKIDYPMKKIESAIATNNVLLLKDFLLHTENRKEFIYMALDYNSLNVLEFLLHFPKLEEGVANSPYFYVQGKEAFQLLQKHSYDVNVKNYEGKSLAEYYYDTKGIEFFKYFLEEAAKLDLSKENSLIFKAIASEDIELIHLLIKRKADFTVLDKKGNYPIYYAKTTAIISRLLDFPYDLQHKNFRKENVLGEVYLRLQKSQKRDLLRKCARLSIDSNYSSYQKEQ